ncbi:MAG: hypothetical protein WBL61_13150 [Bryobacteraceae bacterium]
MQATLSQPDDMTMWQAAAAVIARPWKTFVVDWNWKAALLSALFRGILFLIVAVPRGPGAMRLVWIELAFRILVGGFWGSLQQAFRGARPAWLAGLLVAVLLPATAHALEYLALQAGHATHIGAGMVVSIAVSVGSLLLNWFLMRKGVLITGNGSDSLGADLRRLPRLLAAFFLAPSIALRRAVIGRA